MKDELQSGTAAKGGFTRREVLKIAGTAAAAAAASTLGAPAILRAQSAPIKIGHMVNMTGLLAAMGEYQKMGAAMAADEINAAGGVLGRKIELLAEDPVNAGTAVQKVTKLVTQDKVDCIMGFISSADCLASMEVCDRNKRLLINTGANSDEIRGAKCNYYTFSVEAMNSQYVKTIGTYLLKNKQYKKWYFLTSDYAFGHDLLRVSRRLLKQMGGDEIGSELIPTGTMDFSSYLLKVKNGNPDVIFQNLAGTDQTNFLKQYKEFGLKYDVAGGLIDTALVWPVGVEGLTGQFPIVWWMDIGAPGVKEFTEKCVKKYGKPPENQAWCEYVSVRFFAEAIKKAGTTDSGKVVEAMEKVKLDLMKGRELSFRDWDHQLMQPMYVVKVKTKAESKDKWDIWKVEGEVPAKNESLEVIAATKEENPCTFKK